MLWCTPSVAGKRPAAAEEFFRKNSYARKPVPFRVSAMPPKPHTCSQPSHDPTAQPLAAAHTLAAPAALGCGEDVASRRVGDPVGQVEGGDFPAKQLCMVIDAAGVRAMPDVVLPAGYAPRTYRVGDEVTLAGTLRAAGFVDWDVARVLDYLEDTDRRAGSAVVEHEETIVASTFASRLSSGSTSPVTGSRASPGGKACWITWPRTRITRAAGWAGRPVPPCRATWWIRAARLCRSGRMTGGCPPSTCISRWATGRC